MIKLWGKMIKSNRFIGQHVVVCSKDMEYQDQLKECIIQLCYHFDLEKPYWLEKNLKEFNRMKKTSFTQDNFIEQISFDRFEIEVLDEK